MDSSLLNKYTNKWVLLSSDRRKVLAFARSLNVLVKKTGKSKNKNTILHFVLPNKGTYSP